MGSGAAFFDYDNDGRLDVLLIQNAGPSSASRNQLYHQEPDGSFKDVSAGSGLDVAGYGMGVAVGDVNNDGLPDVLLTSYGSVRLFLNRGGGHFEDVTKAAGLETPGWSVSAAFGDYDRDGWLDLAVVQYVAFSDSLKCAGPAGQQEFCPPVSFQGSSTRVYHNLGRAVPNGGVRFEDVSFACGVGRIPGPGLGVVWADFDGDGWPDLFVANDDDANRLWMNQHDGTFRDEAVVRGVAYNANGAPQANMGIALADLGSEGRFAAYVTHLTEELNVLWSPVRGVPGYFQDQTGAAGLGEARWRGTGFGTVFGDFTNAGAADLAVVNGRVRRSRIPSAGAGQPRAGDFWVPYRERNQLFQNDGNGHFHDVSESNPAFCAVPNVGRGLACGDIDNDGGLDLLVTQVGGPARLYRNVVERRGHWLTVRATDPTAGGRDAYGAHVVLRAGGRERHGWVNPGYSYACSNDPRVHFGLGDVATADAIEVTWPDGRREAFDGGVVDRVIQLSRGSGRAVGDRH